MAKNARFLFWWADGFVKLTLKPGQSLSCYQGAKDEEGYNCTSVNFRYDVDDTKIYREDTTWGRDCDGGHSFKSESYCAVSRLRSHKLESGELIPTWEEIDSSQYDQYAEMAGY